MSRARGPGAPGWLLAAAVAVCILYTAAEVYQLSGHLGFPLDDSWIHLQFARNLATGQGLSYDGGRLVAGSTAPLWTALLSLVFLLPGDPVVWTKLLGVVLFVAGIVATHALARELGMADGPATLAAALAGGTSWLVWSALSGMEIPLFVLLSVGALVLHVRERRDPSRPPLALPLIGLASLARPEGLLLLALAAVDRLLVFRRTPDGWRWTPPPRGRLALGLGLALLVIAPVVSFNLAVGSTPLPTTFAAKAAGLRRLLPETRYLSVVLGILLPPQPYATLLAAAGGVTLLRRWGRPADRGLLPLLWLAGLPLVYSTLSPLGEGVVAGNFGRYFFPLFPLVTVLGVLALEPLRDGLAGAPGGERGRRMATVLAVGLLLWPTLSTLAWGALRYAQTVANVEDSDVRIARWLAPRLPPQALLAVNDIGAIKYLLPNPIVDLAGIVDPEARAVVLAALGRGESRAQGFREFLEARRPDYLVVFPSWYPWLGEPGSPFTPLLVQPIPANITMGGDEVGIFSTPWTRYPLARIVEPGTGEGIGRVP